MTSGFDGVYLGNLPEAERLERLKSARDQIGKLHDRWDNRLTFKGLAFAKCYLEGSLKLLIQECRLGGNPAEHFTIVYRADVAIVHLNGEPADHHTHIGNAPEMTGGDQHVMFVSNIEAMECDQRLVCRKGHEQISSLRGQSIYFSIVEGVFKTLRVFSDGECHLIGGLPIKPCQIARHEIEHGAEIVNYVTDNWRKIAGDRLPHSHYHTVIEGIGISLDDYSIRVAREERDDLGFELRDVSFGPFNL